MSLRGHNSTARMGHTNEVVIAVMGATGSGKSSFINMISGSQLAVGYGLKSCTAGVERSKSFELFGRRVTLIDTPGFDDTTISDTDVLKMIALYMSTTYESGYRLSGIIYMHRISDFRVGGVSRRNFSMFRKLCGDETLKNVVIVTNMWGEVTLERGAARELELATDDLLFKPVLSNGARMVRHSNIVSSAEAVLLYLIHNRPRALQIQQELVDDGKDISETAAGQELARELVKLEKKHREQLAEVQKELKEAMKAKDTQTKKELEHVRKTLEDSIAKVENDRLRLSEEYAEEKKRTDIRVQEVMNTFKEERESRAQREQELSRLIQDLERENRISAAEREDLLAQIESLQNQQREGFFLGLGKILDAAFMFASGAALLGGFGNCI